MYQPLTYITKQWKTSAIGINLTKGKNNYSTKKRFEPDMHRLNNV